MLQQERIRPRVGYQYHSSVERILPRENYRTTTLHTKELSSDSMVNAVEAEWCPVCLSRSISERLVEGKAVWHCNACQNEW